MWKRSFPERTGPWTFVLKEGDNKEQIDQEKRLYMNGVGKVGQEA